jgi:membrane protein
MKPDITDKKENLEEEYQRPPLREEIEKFFSEAKTVTKFVALGLGVFFLISIRNSLSPILSRVIRFVGECANAIYLACMNALQTLVEWANSHPEKIVGLVASVALLILCYYLIMTCLKHRHYIYQRFRIGHFSEMMWFGIGALVVQVATIGSSVYLGIWLPVLLIEGILVGLIFRNFIVFKQLRPTLPRPLTKRENKERLRLIKDLYRISKPYEIDLGDWDSPLEAMTRLALIADFYPDKLSIITYDEFFLKFRTYKEIEDVYTISFKDDDLYTIYSKRVKEAMDKMTSSSIVNEEQLQQIFLDYFE